MAEVDAIARRAAENVRAPEVTREDRHFSSAQRLAARILRIAIAVLVLIAVALAIWRLRGVWSGPPASPPAVAAETPVRANDRPPPAAMSMGAPIASPPPGGAPGAGAVAPRPTPTPAPDRTTESALRIEFNVTSDCWVQIRADGLVVFERLLHAGEHQQFSAEHEVALDVGDAGAFAWSINGRPAKPLGKAGAHKQALVTLATVSLFLQ